MLSRKEIDFTAYNQEFKLTKLDLLSRIMVSTLRVLKFTAVAYKLDFYEKMINFMRVVGLAALSNNMSLELKNSSHDAEHKVNHSFIDFLFQFGIIVFINKELVIKSSYKTLIDVGLITKIISRNNYSYESLTGSDKRMVNDFLFVKDLIKKYNHPEYEFQYITKRKNHWEVLITKKKLDYEVRLCETLYNLMEFKISQKIKSPFDEDYYTESGQNAFKNFTKPAFLNYLKKINPGNANISVFDLGCGYGNYIEAVHHLYPTAKITGIEINPLVYSSTKKKFEGIEQIEVINENFFNYAENKKYDFILMNYVLFYFNAAEKKKILDKAQNMLTDNGSIIICQYFSGIEKLKKELAKWQNDYAISKKIETYYGDKILYANTLWNDSVDAFSEAMTWDEFQTIISELSLHIESVTNADKFYYSLFIELKKNG